MKKFSIFGFKFSFDVKRGKKAEYEVYSEEKFFKEKVFYLMLTLFLIALSSKVPMIFKTNNYVVGDVVKSNIYAPKAIIFKDKEAKNKIIEEIINNFEKEYIYSSNASKISINEYKYFYKELVAVRNKKLKSFDYNGFEKTTGKKVSISLVEELLRLKKKDFKQLFKKGEVFLNNSYNLGIYKEGKEIVIREPYNKEFDEFSNLLKEVLNKFIVPNYTYDESKTLKKIEERALQIKDPLVEIKAGSLVAKTGEIITKRKIRILENLGIYTYKANVLILILHTMYLLIISSIFYTVIINFYKKEIIKKNKFRAVFLIMSVTLLGVRFIPNSYLYLIPLDTILFLFMFIVRPRFSIFLFLVALSFMLPIIDFDLKYFIMYILAVTAAGFLSKQIITRSAIIAVGIQLAVLKLLLFFIFSFFSTEETLGITLNAIKIFTSGIFSGMLTIALLPYFERTFNILTVFKLIELADLSHPLLRKLSLDAPGTFQHSMMVAVLSENAVLKIGGNGIFTRVACYYHDIGKTKRPQFFVENQANGENLHNEISPTMSKMIILSHTKDGVEMAKKHQIPKEVRDIMLEHHGTTLISYFYNKAKEISPEVTEEEFRYSGPKPQSKESAVIMLADSVEAAVRSLNNKNPVAVEQMIRKLVNIKLEDNQLSDANITFKEIEIIIQSFLKTFSAIYHERIKYPGQKG